MKENGLNLWKLNYIWKEILNDELNWTKYIFLNLIKLNTIQLNWIQQFDFKFNWIEFKINQRKMGCKLVEKVWKLRYIHEHCVAKKKFQKYTNIKNHICMPLYMGTD